MMIFSLVILKFAVECYWFVFKSNNNKKNRKFLHFKVKLKSKLKPKNYN